MLLIDWKPLRASYTPLSSNDLSIVKEMKIGFVCISKCSVECYKYKFDISELTKPQLKYKS